MELLGDGSSLDLKSLEAEANATPIIRYVDLILYQAIQDRASDIHFEPFESEFKIRYRVDGSLYEMAPPPRHLALPVISRVKVMSNLNIAERRLPQDGRIQKDIAGRQVDLFLHDSLHTYDHETAELEAVLPHAGPGTGRGGGGRAGCGHQPR